MSIRYMTHVWSVSPFRGTTLLIHLALADHANDEGLCWPSQNRLASKARCTVRHVRSAIKLLTDLGYVTIVQASDGRKNHLYRVEWMEETSGDPGNPPPKNRHITITPTAVSLDTQLSTTEGTR